jgi:hypothetical protein
MDSWLDHDVAAYFFPSHEKSCSTVTYPSLISAWLVQALNHALNLALNHALNLALIAPPTQNEVGPRSDFRIADFKGCVLLPLLLLLFE